MPRAFVLRGSEREAAGIATTVLWAMPKSQSAVPFGDDHAHEALELEEASHREQQIASRAEGVIVEHPTQLRAGGRDLARIGFRATSTKRSKTRI